MHVGSYNPRNIAGTTTASMHSFALAVDLRAGRGLTARYNPLAAMARNLALYPVVLAHGFRRLVPW